MINAMRLWIDLEPHEGGYEKAYLVVAQPSLGSFDLLFTECLTYCITIQFALPGEVLLVPDEFTEVLFSFY